MKQKCGVLYTDDIGSITACVIGMYVRVRSARVCLGIGWLAGWLACVVIPLLGVCKSWTII